MVHGDAITHSDSVGLERHPATGVYSLLDSFGDTPQVYMSRDNFTEAVDYAHEGLVNVGPGYTDGMQQGAMPCPLQFFLDSVTFHLFSPILIVRNLKKKPSRWDGSRGGEPTHW